MKSLKLSVVLPVLLSLMATSILSAGTAMVVAEDPDGAQITRGGASIMVSGGDVLMEGDVLSSNAATVVVSICDGALVTIYPDSEVAVSSLAADVAVLNLVKGELLGDTISGCEVSIANAAGSADISNGVYGVLMNQTGDGWTLQVRNLNGEVSFTGAPGLDTGNVTASIIEAGQTFQVPAGEELIVRGIYNMGEDIFTLVAGGAAVGGLPDAAIDNMNEVAKEHNAIREQGPEEGETPPPPGPPSWIELPFEDIDTASDKG